MRLHSLYSFSQMCCALLSVVACGANTKAGEHDTVIVNELILHSGVIGVYDAEPVDNFAALEIRLKHHWHNVRPWAGMTVVDSGTWFAGGGFVYDFRLPGNFRVTIGSGPFYYRRGTDHDKDLGFDLEFYSFIEVTTRFNHGASVGLRLGHLSNAGLGRRNPGTETFALVVSNPL